MRSLALFVAISSLACCGKASVSPSEPVGPAVVQFLLTSAAKDFHAHNPPSAFRDVRVGRVKLANGETQYRMCGEFMPAKGDKPEWTPFATLKMSDYEQFIGEGSERYRQDPTGIWDEADWSSALQSKLDALQ